MPANYIELLRVRWWLKNLFIFLPVFFTGHLGDHSSLSLLIGFFAFSLFTSFCYIINDIQDMRIDRHHPQKKNRPVAAHAIKTTQAIRIAVGCLVIAMALSFFLPVHFLWLAGLYVILNILYSVSLKKMSIINLFIPVLGYIIRIYIGGVITNTVVTMWLVILVFLLALIFIILHRREDLLMFVDESDDLNRSVRGYSLEFLNLSLAITTSAFMAGYLMFCISPDTMLRFGSVSIYISTFIVLAGLLRYLQLAIVRNQSPDPSDLIFKDAWLLLIILIWIGYFTYIIYVWPI